MQRPEWIKPDWSAPEGVYGISTTRSGGCSQGCYSGFNLGAHVGDHPQHVTKNRRLLCDVLHLPGEPAWLEQRHSTQVIRLPAPPADLLRADAAYTTTQGVICAVQTADCLPVLFCDRQGSCVAVAHGGWRGLLDGILESTLRALPVHASELLCWLGPAIGPGEFEIDDALRERFVKKDPDLAPAFAPGRAGKCLADLYQIARRTLAGHGVHSVSGGEHCTYTQSQKFFSHRRDGTTGRMATLIWLDSQ